MSSYAQVTIHSEKSKINKSKGKQNRGRVIKGWRLGLPNTLIKKILNKQEVVNTEKSGEQWENNVLEVETLKKNQLTIKQQILKQKQVLSSKQVYEDAINSGRFSTGNTNVVDSDTYPSIFYKKTTMRSVLKQFIFPNDCQALPPNDERSPLIHQIIVNLFNQISISIYNILIARNSYSNSYFIFFSDAEVTPYTKCCHALVYVEIKNNSSGFIRCNGKYCKHPYLAQFAIDYEDGKKIWKDLTFITTTPLKDMMMKDQIAKCIWTGRYKSVKLKKMISNTSKLVEQQFYSKKKQIDVFVTNGASSKPFKSQKKMNGILNEEEMAQLTSGEDKNIESLKMKLSYISKRHHGLQAKFARSIIDDGKIFNKQFQMSEKIDEIMRKTKISDSSTFNSFPRLMDQMRNQQQRKNRSFYKKQNCNSFLRN